LNVKPKGLQEIREDFRPLTQIRVTNGTFYRGRILPANGFRKKEIGSSFWKVLLMKLTFSQFACEKIVAKYHILETCSVFTTSADAAKLPFD
jgi:hypothetical protein